MTTIFLIILLITQVISFYFIALLYMKVSKFDDLERKQSQLMKEMDDAIAVYLTEIKDENEQLIEKLTVKVNEKPLQSSFKEKPAEAIGERQEEQREENAPPLQVTVPQQTMRHYARKSYGNVQQNNVEVNDDHVEKKLAREEVDDRTRAIQLSAAGLSIEEIAKELDKGRTEIELILKFK